MTAEACLRLSRAGSGYFGFVFVQKEEVETKQPLLFHMVAGRNRSGNRVDRCHESQLVLADTLRFDFRLSVIDLEVGTHTTKQSIKQQTCFCGNIKTKTKKVTTQNSYFF